MSSDRTAVSVRGLGKRYYIYHNRERAKSIEHAIVRRLRDPLSREQRETFWALRNVSFDVQEGEIVGIVGKNGAGKSTILKILSRITPPTEGEVELYGRTGSLLEVGTGFHRELTGRENIYLNGGILGMSRREIDKHFDEIVEFSGTERFLDTPVKRYSSGMFVRLAFAVAAHLRTEILIVDEVLAVGDDAFQRKCLGKMSEVANDGRTVLFVSHNMHAIATLTQRCLLLKEGRVACDTTPRDAIMNYLRTSHGDGPVYIDDPSPKEPRIVRVEMRTSCPGNTQIYGEAMEIEVHIHAPEPIPGARLAIKALDDMRRQMFYVWSYDSERPMCRESGLHRIVCRIPKCRLYKGSYTLLLHFMEKYGGKKFPDVEQVCPFTVTMTGLAREGGWYPDQGAYIEDCEWDISKIDTEALLEGDNKLVGKVK